MMWCSIALRSATSVPGSIWRWMSARCASSMRLGGVRAEKKEHVALMFHLAHGPRRRAGVHGALHGAHGRRVAESRAVVDVVRADARPEQPLQQVVLLVGALGGGKHRETVRSA